MGLGVLQGRSMFSFWVAPPWITDGVLGLHQIYTSLAAPVRQAKSQMHRQNTDNFGKLSKAEVTLVDMRLFRNWSIGWKLNRAVRQAGK